MLAGHEHKCQGDLLQRTPGLNEGVNTEELGEGGFHHLERGIKVPKKIFIYVYSLGSLKVHQHTNYAQKISYHVRAWLRSDSGKDSSTCLSVIRPHGATMEISGCSLFCVTLVKYILYP